MDRGVANQRDGSSDTWVDVGFQISCRQMKNEEMYVV